MGSRSVVFLRCPPARQGRLPEADAKELAAAFKALADPVRLRLLSFIAAQPSGEACVCHLTEPAGLSQPTVSHHLRLLYEAGLVERERRSNWVYYRIARERVAAIRDALVAPPGRQAPRSRKARAAAPRWAETPALSQVRKRSGGRRR